MFKPMKGPGPKPTREVSTRKFNVLSCYSNPIIISELIEQVRIQAEQFSYFNFPEINTDNIKLEITSDWDGDWNLCALVDGVLEPEDQYLKRVASWQKKKNEYDQWCADHAEEITAYEAKKEQAKLEQEELQKQRDLEQTKKEYERLKKKLKKLNVPV